MAASFPKSIFLIGTVITASSCAQTTSTSPDEESGILAHLTNMVAKDLIELESSIDSCSTKASSRGAVDLKDTTIEGSGPSNETLMLGISHLYFNNLFECERPAREKLAFSLGILKSLSPSHQQLPSDIKGINAGLLYPTKKQIEYAVQYQSLPEAIRAFLEGQIGEEPFELMSTLEKNGIINK